MRAALTKVDDVVVEAGDGRLLEQGPALDLNIQDRVPVRLAGHGLELVQVPRALDPPAGELAAP